MLNADGFEMPRDVAGVPLLLDAMPSFEDKEERGSVAYKIGREEGVFASESRMCWNDFIDCDFTSADLTRADIRASLFERCRFTGATLVERTFGNGRSTRATSAAQG